MIVVERNFKASLMMQSAPKTKEATISKTSEAYVGEPLVIFENKIEKKQE